LLIQLLTEKAVRPSLGLTRWKHDSPIGGCRQVRNKSDLV
jgi:hypothetical protein